ncbi:MAG TPA: TatD family hydrolase [Acidimicrobiales bacterium]|nr:TatD family hydrolase [Acidimicrobiales bacterium]
MSIRWTDDHCHLGWDVDEQVDAAEVDAMVAEALDAGVERLVTVGTDALRSAEAVRAAARHPGVVWATVGLHPHEARHGLDGVVDLLGEAGPSGRGSGEHSLVVAVGECGLDYHYDHSPRPAQRAMFAAQIVLAHERDLALVIHTREAWDDTFAILDAEGTPARTVFHCFTGGPDEVRSCLDRGAYVSFSGIVTFRAADDVREAAATCPLERLLVETDSPYLAPVPYRGRPNRPALVPLVGAAVADVKGVPVEAVAEATWANAERVYGLN